MKKFWYLFYNVIFIPLAKIILMVAQLFNPKIKLGIAGRKKLFENLIINLAGLDRRKKMIWFHSASMGEFEQAKPIIEKIKSQKDVNIIVSFFSPSGYNNSLRYSYADVIVYFPFDTTLSAERFIKIVQPDIAIFMRYDIWPNMIWKLEENHIPFVIVDATMRVKTARKWFIAKSFHKSLFNSFTKILCVSENDLNNFLEFNIKPEKLKSVGDTRFDRVYQKSLEAKEKKIFKENIFENKKVLVVGSSWESDEEVLIPAINKLIKYDRNLVVIIVPHEPTVLHIENLEHQFLKVEKSIRFSLLNEYKNERIILIDTIGILLTLYYYANVAYVGGSFKQGIHNVLEPAVYSIPILFGPKNENSQEAQELKRIGGAFEVKNKKEAYKTLRKLLTDEKYRVEKGKINYNFVLNNIGATDKIINEIDSIL